MQLPLAHFEEYPGYGEIGQSSSDLHSYEQSVSSSRIGRTQNPPASHMHAKLHASYGPVLSGQACIPVEPESCAAVLPEPELVDVAIAEESDPSSPALSSVGMLTMTLQPKTAMIMTM